MAEWSTYDHGSMVKCTENSGSKELINWYLSKSVDDDVKWDDCDEKLRYLFDQVLMVLLKGVNAKKGSRPIPALLGDGQTVDLFKLFCIVRDRGGYHAVSKDKLWGLIAEKLGFDCRLCGSLKLIYYKYLDELDQWLNRITRDRISANGSYECGGSLGLLSLELENRLRNFSTDDKEFTKDADIQYDNFCKHINVAIKETLSLPDTKEGTEMHNVVVKFAVDDREGLCESKVFAGKAKQNVINDDITTRDTKEGTEMHNVVIKFAVDDREGLCESKVSAGKAKQSVINEYITTPATNEGAEMHDVVVKFSVDDDRDELCESKVFAGKAKQSLIDEDITTCDTKDGTEMHDVVVKFAVDDDREGLCESKVFAEKSKQSLIEEDITTCDTKDGTEMHNVVVKFAVDDDRQGLCESKMFAGKAKQSVINEDITTRKRKRDIFGETLSWMIRVAKNPGHPAIALQGCSRGKESGYEDFWSLALSVREARLQKRYTDLNDQQSQFNQKKNKMHPSMYEDNIISDQLSAEGLRCSERLSSLVNPPPPCQCCKSSSSIHKCKFKKLSESPFENEPQKQELVNDDTSDTKRVIINVEDAPVENHILVGPEFQAEVPLWTGIISESDSKWLGTQIWTPDLQEGTSYSKPKPLGKGRPLSCKCNFPGSVECYRFHIAENRMKLRRELGLAFFHWKFDRMGEEVSLSWSAEEEQRFKEVIRLNNPFLGKSFFPRKTRMDLVSYYFNVFLIKRRSYQNRVNPKAIDSDDDEAEFGSVSEAFGYSAVKVRGSEPLKCLQNEQIMDLD